MRHDPSRLVASGERVSGEEGGLPAQLYCQLRTGTPTGHTPFGGPAVLIGPMWSPRQGLLPWVPDAIQRSARSGMDPNKRARNDLPYPTCHRTWPTGHQLQPPIPSSGPSTSARFLIRTVQHTAPDQLQRIQDRETF